MSKTIVMLSAPDGQVAGGTITGFPAILIIVAILALIVIGAVTVAKKVRGRK